MSEAYVMPNHDQVPFRDMKWLDDFHIDQYILAPGELCRVYSIDDKTKVLRKTNGHLSKETINGRMCYVPEIEFDDSDIFRLMHKLRYVCGIYKVKRIFWRIMPTGVSLTGGLMHFYCIAGFLLEDGKTKC